MVDELGQQVCLGDILECSDNSILNSKHYTGLFRLEWHNYQFVLVPDCSQKERWAYEDKGLDPNRAERDFDRNCFYTLENYFDYFDDKQGKLNGFVLKEKYNSEK